jgi:Holliday junction DNA helicase RuvA
VTLLSGLEIEDLVAAIRKGEIARLISIPGVGRKTAERLTLELREKLATFAAGEPERAAAPAVESGSVEDDVLSALMNLGYARAAAESAFREARAASPNGDFENWLRGSLRLLARKFFK